jgi:hypothetical protein
MILKEFFAFCKNVKMKVCCTVATCKYISPGEIIVTTQEVCSYSVVISKTEAFFICKPEVRGIVVFVIRDKFSDIPVMIIN